MILLAFALADDARDDFDLGRDRLNAIESAAPSALREATDRLVLGAPKVLTHLVGLVERSGPPYDAEALIASVEDLADHELHLILLGYHDLRHRVADGETLRRAVAGDEEALAAVREAAEEWETWCDVILGLLDMPSAEVKEATLTLLRGWAAVFAAELGEEALEPMRQDAAQKQALAAEISPERLVELATNGVEFVRDRGIRRLVLLPSYVFRPWVLLGEHDDARLIAYPVADEHLELEGGEPPPRLVKLYKALGDERRLRLLHRLGDGPVTLKEAATELGVAKSTAHHHLSVLRQAGLVLVRDEDEKRYSLRGDELPRSNDLLVRYLGRGTTDDLD